MTATTEEHGTETTVEPLCSIERRAYRTVRISTRAMGACGIWPLRFIVRVSELKMLRRNAALLCLLLLCGCLRPVNPPAPEPDVPVVSTGLIADMARQYDANFRESCLIAAGKLRSGAWKTDREYLEGHKALRKIAVEHAGQDFADRQQAEATPFTPASMADWLEKIAREGK